MGQLTPRRLAIIGRPRLPAGGVQVSTAVCGSGGSGLMGRFGGGGVFGG
ncbi:hypothetical protein [Streptomyces hesseae]|uniref:Uncharacterized protein n=1 Tax=Streptomyces hesseae TaxID=3075519 RepID=A0ABU2T0C8_9ACTN|nr:hypothetical protein [Streptomyces sp. DSM 40473]MDT0453630.1 hypothetical protein [Streptomyces sp. DSM 40473]